MDPNDLLFLHSTLAATIRQQRADLDQQAVELDRLTAEVARLSTPTEENPA